MRTTGLADAQIESASARHPELVEAIEAGYAAHLALRSNMADVLRMDEAEQIAAVQADFVNFYPEDGVNPYVALAARGPWVVTLKGAVVYDAGGYGMLPFGHTPKAVLEALARPQVMANVMTPSLVAADASAARSSAKSAARAAAVRIRASSASTPVPKR